MCLIEGVKSVAASPCGVERDGFGNQIKGVTLGRKLWLGRNWSD